MYLACISQADQISYLIERLAIERPRCSGSRDRDLGVTSPEEKQPCAPLLHAGADASSPLSPLWRRARARKVAGEDADDGSPPRTSPLSTLRFSLSPLTKRPTKPINPSTKQRLSPGQPGAWREELREQRHTLRADRLRAAKVVAKAGTQGQVESLALPRHRFRA